jgi:hypothetical protein
MARTKDDDEESGQCSALQFLKSFPRLSDPSRSTIVLGFVLSLSTQASIQTLLAPPNAERRTPNAER